MSENTCKRIMYLNHSTVEDNRIYVIGNNNTIFGSQCRVEGRNNNVRGPGCYVVGDCNTILGKKCKVEGNKNYVFGEECDVCGYRNRIYGDHCVVKGESTIIGALDCVFKGENNKDDCIRVVLRGDFVDLNCKGYSGVLQSNNDEKNLQSKLNKSNYRGKISLHINVTDEHVIYNGIEYPKGRYKNIYSVSLKSAKLYLGDIRLVAFIELTECEEKLKKLKAENDHLKESSNLFFNAYLGKEEIVLDEINEEEDLQVPKDTLIELAETKEKLKKLTAENEQLKENNGLFLKAYLGEEEIDLDEIDKDEEFQTLINENGSAFKEKKRE